MLRRWRGAWPKRGRIWQVPPAAEAPAPPAFPPLFIRAALRGRFLPLARRGRFQAIARPYDVPEPSTGQQRASRRALPTRRGAYAEPPWAQVAAEPSVWRPGWLHAVARLAGRPIRRSQYHEPPWLQVAAQPSVWRPEFQRPAGARPRFAAKLRRGRFLEPSWQLPTHGTGSAGGVGEGNRRALVTRRGQYHEPPWLQVAAQPSVWRPSVVRAVNRLAGRPYRRGVFHEPPWPPVAAQPSVWRPQIVRATLRLAGRPFRRGQFLEPPWPQAEQAEPPARPPDRITSRAVAARPIRRGEFLWTPPRPVGAPAWLRTRPRPLPYQRRRRRFHEPRWVEGPQSVWRPDPVCPAGNRPRWPTHRLRRGRFAEPGWPQGIQFIGAVPRFVEGGTTTVALIEGGGGGSGQVEGGGGGAGQIEGGGSI